MHTYGSWAWNHCLHEVSQRPLTRHSGTHSSPMHPSLPDCVSFPCFHKHQPAAGSSNSSAPCWLPRTTNTRNWKHVFVILKLSLVPSAVSKSKYNILTVTRHSIFITTVGKSTVLPGACLQIEVDRNLCLCLTWYLVLVTWFCCYYKAASSLINQNNSQAPK